MILNRFSLAGEIAIVTGSARGIGRGIALAFAEAGADLVCVDRRVSDMEATAEEIRARGRRALAVECDVRDRQQVENMVARAMEDFGRINILVNNAGRAPLRQVLEMSVQDWETDIRANLTSMFICSQAVARVMLEHKAGSIVNISSRESQMPSIGMISYGAAKAAVNSLTLTLAWELAPRVRVNAILPGPIRTPMNVDWLTQVEDQLVEGIPLKRIGTPEDIALAALYLASSASDWVTGRLFEIDGGVEFSHLA
ncbi:SDR family NAD(P)-dependent oxidoreductase [Chloroflexota bacterium]